VRFGAKKKKKTNIHSYNITNAHEQCPKTFYIFYNSKCLFSCIALAFYVWCADQPIVCGFSFRWKINICAAQGKKCSKSLVVLDEHHFFSYLFICNRRIVYGMSSSWKIEICIYSIAPPLKKKNYFFAKIASQY
jgi:hypothetical protein